MNHTIDTASAKDQAEEIKAIVSQIETDLDTLNSAMTSNIPDRVETEWSDEVLSNWNSYYSADVKAALQSMRNDAQNVITTAEASEAYSRN